MRVGIHQPNFLPWLGYFYKLMLAERFVFLDIVQYSKNSFINRNRIKTPQGPSWLTVPVRAKGRFGQSIGEVEIVWDADWRRKHLNSLVANYGRAPFFEEVFPQIQLEYRKVGPGTLLAEFNISLAQQICAYLGLNPQFVRARDLKVEGTDTALLVSICKSVGASRYLAGGGAVKYQADEQFASAGIEVEYSRFRGQPYPQVWNGFVENLSIVDALMNCGRATRDLLSPPPGTEGVSEKFCYPESPAT